MRVPLNGSYGTYEMNGILCVPNASTISDFGPSIMENAI